MFNNNRSKGMVNTGNIKRSLQVPLKNHKVSMSEGPKTKELLDFLRAISGPRMSHTQVHLESHLESHLALPSKCYSDSTAKLYSRAQQGGNASGQRDKKKEHISE